MALFVLKDEVGAAEINAVTEALNELRSGIDVVVDLECGVPVEGGSSTAGFAVTATFDTVDDLRAYLAHPDHQHFSKNVLGPHVDSKSIAQIHVDA